MRNFCILLCTVLAVIVGGCKDETAAVTTYTVVYTITGNASPSRVRYLTENSDTASSLVTVAPWSYTWGRKGVAGDRVYLEVTIPQSARTTDSLVLVAKVDTRELFRRVVNPSSMGNVTVGSGSTVP